ncbi:transposase [Rhizobium herbae]
MLLLAQEVWMLRFVLREDQWKRLRGLLPGKDSDPGRSGYDTGFFLKRSSGRSGVGAPWRDLPDAFGPWNSVFNGFAVGRRKVFSNRFSMPCRETRISNTQ